MIELLQMAEVLQHVYADVIDELLIIDCRYPYEYDGGHIKVSPVVYHSFIIPSLAGAWSRGLRRFRQFVAGFHYWACSMRSMTFVNDPLQSSL